MALPPTVFVGEKYGRLTVIEWCKPKSAWLCKCECGRLVYQNTSHLRSGNVLSCGCYRKECDVLDGLSNTREYNSFRMMHMRCSPGATQRLRKDYYDRGISVCSEWELSPEGFKQFLADMGSRPTGTTLERKSIDHGYTKENCKWDTPTNQAFNRSMFKNNRSGVTGVSFDNHKGMWIAYVHKNRQSVRKAFINFDDAVVFRKEQESLMYKEKIDEIQQAVNQQAIGGHDDNRIEELH